jgi:hypothetical protein
MESIVLSILRGWVEYFRIGNSAKVFGIKRLAEQEDAQTPNAEQG